MRHRLPAVIAIAMLVLVPVALTGAIPSLAEQTTSSWGDLTSLGFGLALLIAWPIGTLIFTKPRRRHRS